MVQALDKMAAASQSGHSSRFAGVKTFSEKFTQPELDEQGRVRKVSVVYVQYKTCLYEKRKVKVVSGPYFPDFPHDQTCNGH